MQGAGVAGAGMWTYLMSQAIGAKRAQASSMKAPWMRTMVGLIGVCRSSVVAVEMQPTQVPVLQSVVLGLHCAWGKGDRWGMGMGDMGV